MHFVCWIPKAKNTHSEYVILSAFPLQQWLHERASILRCRFSACLVPKIQVVPLTTEPGISFNNSNTNEDIAKKFEQEYVRCMRNEEECVCSLLQISLQYPH